MNPAKQNPPITAAGLAAAVNGLIVAFGHFTDEQNAAIGAVVIALVLDGQLQLWPAHVQVVPGATVDDDGYLSLRPGKPRVDDQQPEPGLARRLSACVIEIEHLGELT